MLKFENYIVKLLSEADEQPSPDAANDAGNDASGAPEEGMEGGMPAEEEELSGKQSFPEEIVLANLAIRSLNFNIKSKNVNNLKMKINGKTIPLEKISDYYEKTKRVSHILGFIDWSMNYYEGAQSKWLEKQTKGILREIKELNKELPEQNRLDNNDRLDWTRIILNCFLKGSPDYTVNIPDVNEDTVKEIRNMLSQAFGGDSRGILAGITNIRGPSTF